MQNASKWKGNCFAGFFSSKCWCAFLRRVAFFVCHNAGSRWGDEDVGMGPCRCWVRGHGFDVAPARVQSWAATEVLPPKMGRCRSVASRRTGFALGGMAGLREMRLFGMINNEAGINPPASSNFIWTFVLSSVCSSTTFPSHLPPLADGLGGEQSCLLH